MGLREKFLHSLRKALFDQLRTIQAEKENVKPSGLCQWFQATRLLVFLDV
jgi:hypothetical protein